MKLFINIILLFLVQFCNGQDFQFGIIKDVDGFVNVRDEANSSSKIIDKLPNNSIISYFEFKDNWILIDYIKNNELKNGYVYKNRIKPINDFQKLKKVQKTQNLLEFTGGSLKIIIEVKKFEKNKHTYKYYNENKNQIYKIDNKVFYGTDGNIPRTEYKEINVLIGEKTISIPKNAFQDLFEPNLEFMYANFDNTDDSLYIYALNGDGAGGYAVIWVVEKQEYKDRMVTIPF